jgi:hypothetical protein
MKNKSELRILFTILFITFITLLKGSNIVKIPIFRGNTSVEFPKFINSKIDRNKFKINQTYFFELTTNEKGKVENARLKIGEEDETTKEIIKIIMKMPKWTPKKEKGKSIKAVFVVPLVYK